ncbi:ABC-type amino acid transport substrate-binding protein [Rhodoferax sp. OV413]|uniref:ABC transporter substrate-binding protein n=1 Tax=Rhodoferax sp. OV413 TaxID=1855285 RepID=UPI00088AB0A0|nr:ABC transporter substrate-binding protein [Rhodoferax sp. OV413]SDO18592.1 ABC-type amino acid transport substrate-binding protein [Rhodoferax sp. OV413]
MHLIRGLAVVALCGVASLAWAGKVADRAQSSGTLRVCIWPDYYGVSHRNPNTQQLEGVDIDLSAELARDLKLKLQYVDSSFPTLVDDLNNERCDVAMFAVGMLPQRMQHLRFSRPYLQSDIYGMATKSSRVVQQWSDIDQPGVLVGVQAGTFMEPIMRAHLKRAQMVVVKPPASRESELEAGRIDVFMTDYPYSRRLLDNADWARLISPSKPFSVLPYGYAVKQGDDTWWKKIDAFVERVQRDGRLETAAKRHGLSAIVVHK